ncbi:MAG: photosystem II stability/assembly factor-like uncharacterized protein [Neolewinella sp.]|jgi:photosystem II stability/assembly factor-like uncharacterized protein
MNSFKILFFLLICSGITRLSAQSSLEQLFRSSQKFSEIVSEGDAYFTAKYAGLSKSDLTTGEHRDGEYVKFQRWQSFWKDNLNPDGTLGDLSAYGRKQSSNPSQPDKLNNPYTAIPWTEVNYTGYITGQIGLGRTTSIGFHPTDVNTFYVGAAIGGVWKTTDGGQSYVPLGDDLPFLAVSSVIVDQTNPSILYIAISDHVFYGPQGIGVYKSTDGGTTWAPTSLSFSFGQNVRIYWMEAHPTDPDIMFVATANGLYRTDDGFATNDRIITAGVFDVKVRPGAAATVFAGGRNGEVFRSTDGGLSFTEVVDLGNGSVLLGVTPLDNTKVFARSGDQLYKSLDAGLTFPSSTTMGQSNEVFAIAPQDDDIILTGNFETRRSDDGGATFTATSQWLGNSGLPLIHVDQRNMFVNPLENDAVYYCNDGGLYRYIISTNSFENLSDGLAITQYYDIAVSQTNANVIGGGSQDNGNVFRDESGNWVQYASTGDGMNQEIDPTDASYRYWAYQYGGMRRWHNGSNSGIKPADVDYNGAWETPYKLDQTMPTRMIAGFRKVYESLDRGDSWTAISGELAGGSNMNELVIAPSNGERIYVTQGGNLFVKSTTDDTWTSRSLPNGAVSDIEVDSLDIDKVYVSVPGFSDGSKVYVSEDAGARWTNISGSLPNVSVGALELYHEVPGGVFVGTDAGVYYRDDQQSDWLEYGDLPNTRVEDIEIQYAANLIRVGTHGRGILEAGIAIESCTAASSDSDGDGTCDAFDQCPSLNNNLIGTACDDGDSFSSGETYDSNCGCSGGRANLSYCAAEGSAGTGSDYISFVGLAGAENGSGQTNYSDFRNVVMTLDYNTDYTLTARFNYAFDIDRFHAWADWNRDGVFGADEKITLTVPDNNSTSTGTIQVPEGTAEGATTMRVRGVYSETFNEPCGSQAGEVEDYTINVACGAGAGNCAVLPLDWTVFNARSLGKQGALLNWSTAGEEAVSHFEVERSSNGRNFNQLGQLAAMNTLVATYEFIDVDAPGSSAYYRITSVDVDGSRSTTVIRRVDWDAADDAVVIYPNPVTTDAVTVAWQRPEATSTSWYMYNTYGQEVRRGIVGAAAGANKVELATDNLPAGVYLLRLRTKDWDWTGNFIVR